MSRGRARSCGPTPVATLGGIAEITPPPAPQGSLVARIESAALAAERDVSPGPESAAEARRGVVHKTLRLVGGLTLIALGTVCLVIPGPGLVMIFAGLSMLPFRWAERTVARIRRRTPGLREK